MASITSEVEGKMARNDSHLAVCVSVLLCLARVSIPRTLFHLKHTLTSYLWCWGVSRPEHVYELFFADFPSYHCMVAFRLALKQSRKGNLCDGIGRPNPMYAPDAQSQELQERNVSRPVATKPRCNSSCLHPQVIQRQAKDVP